MLSNVVAAGEERFDFVIVGSGAGGGSLAANLAEAGFNVLLLEAGDDHQCPFFEVAALQAQPREAAEVRKDSSFATTTTTRSSPATASSGPSPTACCTRVAARWGAARRSARW